MGPITINVTTQIFREPPKGKKQTDLFAIYCSKYKSRKLSMIGRAFHLKIAAQ